MKKGFTHIELLVVLTVLVILAGGAWVWQNRLTHQSEGGIQMTTFPTLAVKPTTLTYVTPQDLIKAFEEANIKHSSDSANFILSLFIEPTSQEDKNELEYLQGKDLPYRPRLFNAAGAGGLKQVLSYTIKETKKSGDITQVLVDEKVKISSNTGAPTLEKTQEYIFELVPDDTLGWKVLRYYPSGAPGTFTGF